MEMEGRLDKTAEVPTARRKERGKEKANAGRSVASSPVLDSATLSDASDVVSKNGTKMTTSGGTDPTDKKTKAKNKKKKTETKEKKERDSPAKSKAKESPRSAPPANADKAGGGIGMRKSAEDARPHGLSASSLNVLPSFLRRRTNTNSSSKSDSADALPSATTTTTTATTTATAKKKELRGSDGRDDKRSTVSPDLATRSVSHSSAGSGSTIDRSPRSTRKLHRLPGFGLSGNHHDKSILISSDSLMAVLDEDDPARHTTRSSSSTAAPVDADRSRIPDTAEERLGSDMMTTSFGTLSALSSDSTSDEDEGNYWDDAWVADENEAEERRQWEERERTLEAKHRRREAKLRRLDERWEAEEKLRCEARDHRLAEEEQLRRNMAAAASSSGLMTRYGAKKNKTMIILRGMVTRDIPSITTTDSPPPAHMSASGMTRVRSADVPSIEEEKEKEERSDGTSATGAPAKTTTKKFERPPLRRRSGSEADLRRYTDLLVVANHRGRSSSSSGGSSPARQEASSAAADDNISDDDDDKESSGTGTKQKQKTKTNKKKKGSKGTPHGDPRMRRENSALYG